MKARLVGFRQGLEKLGWSEDRSVRVDTRFAAAVSTRIDRQAGQRAAGEHQAGAEAAKASLTTHLSAVLLK